MPINWLVEALKWKYICKKHQIEVGVLKAYASVYFGACAGFVSPGRWGEPLARAYYVGKEKIAQKFSISLIGIISQWIITILLALITFLDTYFSDNNILLIIILLIFFLLLFFFYERFFNLLINRFDFLKTYKVEESNISDKLVVFLYTFIRYSIYTLQYIILLSAFISSDNLMNSIKSTIQMFFYQSFSPLPGVIDYALKNNIALIVYKNLQIEALEILYVVFVIWIINLVLPSIIGYILFNKKLNEFWEKEE